MKRVLLVAFTSVLFSTSSMASETAGIQRFEVIHQIGKTESIVRVQAREAMAEMDYQLYLDIHQQAHNALYEGATSEQYQADKVIAMNDAEQATLTN